MSIIQNTSSVNDSRLNGATSLREMAEILDAAHASYMVATWQNGMLEIYAGDKEEKGKYTLENCFPYSPKYTIPELSNKAHYTFKAGIKLINKQGCKEICDSIDHVVKDMLRTRGRVDPQELIRKTGSRFEVQALASPSA
jgi:hypothetical protein